MYAPPFITSVIHLYVERLSDLEQVPAVGAVRGGAAHAPLLVVERRAERGQHLPLVRLERVRRQRAGMTEAPEAALYQWHLQRRGQRRRAAKQPEQRGQQRA
eukprot:scaffold15602_cov67-Phaeocystis_antarctica.AAC.3